MNALRRNDTVSMAEAAPGFPAPEVTIDLDAYGELYARNARISTALARWTANCPQDMAVTDWKDTRIAAHAAQHARIIGWVYQRTGLLASGPTGHGKSRAMWALMKRLAEEGREIRYYTAAQWFSVLQDQIKYGRDDALGWVSSVARAPIVFIDDLGQEALQASKQEWCAGWFFQFLDMRLGNALPLFITTNLDAKEIAGTSSSVRANPLVRRLLELCEPVKFT
jgi:DNA replication protein DnaC